MSQFSAKKTVSVFASFLCLCFLAVPLPSFASTGSIDSTNKYAWGSQIGWVNFNPSNGNVLVLDTGLSGYAWSENYGWISLNPAQSGVKNDGQGNLSGSAWGENLGYISFSGVKIAQGVFSGTANGSSSGSISFDCSNCKVTTTWRPASNAPSTPVASVGVAASYAPPAALPPSAPLPSSTVFSPSSTPTSSVAPSVSELLAQIQALQVRLAALQAQAGQTGAAPASGFDFVFTRDLSVGASGNDVKALQDYLVSQMAGPAATKLQANGTTHYFGPLTKQTLIEFQKKNGITPPSGYFGPKTRAYVTGTR